MIGTISKTTEILNKYNLSAKKRLGQNFLVEPTIINKVADRITKEDNIIEIGPGLGSLTEMLCEKADKVVAYEIDEDMIEVLNNEIGADNLTVVNEDFMKTDLSSLQEKVTVVSNLPYYITSDLLEKCFKHRDRITCIIAMMQKEVADRFLHNEHGKNYGTLQLLAQYSAECSLLTKVSRKNYIPMPNVDSAILVFRMRSYIRKANDEELLFQIIRDCFARRRKVVSSVLKDYGIQGEDYEIMKISPQSRAEQLSLDDFITISEVVHERKGLRKD